MQTIEDVTFPWERDLSYPDRQRWLSRYRKVLLKNQTPAEKRFASILRELRFKFFPQKGFMYPPRFCIVDFYLPNPHKLCIEIDGQSHSNKLRARKDQVRDAWFRRKGYRVWRFTNNQVFHKPDEIKAALGNLRK